MQRVYRSILCLTLPAFVCLGPTAHAARAEDWNAQAERLVQKIMPQMGSKKTAALAVKNLSSLSDGEVAQARRAMRSQFLKKGIRFVAKPKAGAEIYVTLSENFEGFIWVAEIRRGGARDIAMISVPRPETDTVRPKSETLVIHKKLVFEQDQPILDLASLEISDQGVQRLLVLSPDAISLYIIQSSGWQHAQTVPLAPARPRPRDPRGRLRVRADGTFEVFLPGAKCTGATEVALAADCHASDEPWPLDNGGPEGARAYSVPGRNFFDGRLMIENGPELKLTPFFTSAQIPEKGQTLRLLAGVDGRARLFGVKPEPMATIDGLGADIVSLESSCGGGWQVLSTRVGGPQQKDAIRAFQIHEKNAVAVSAPTEFSGPVTALWPSSNGTTATAVSRNLKTGNYEASVLSISCSE